MATLAVPAATRADLWRTPLIMLGITITALLALFARDAAAMVTIWWTASTFTHCLFILPITLWLVSIRWDQVRLMTPQPGLKGLVMLGAGAGVWLLGSAADFGMLRHTGLVVMLQASVWILLGTQVARGLLFPLFYLVFLIPFGDELVPFFQTITAKICIWLLEVAHVPAKIDGIFITVPNGFYQVAAACSGIKFLVAMLAFGALAAHVCFKSNVRRALFMLAAVIVPVIANGIRAFGTIYIGYLTNTDLAISVDHIIYGWFFFGFVIIVLMLASWPFFDRVRGAPWIDPVPTAPKSRVTPLAALFASLLLMLVPVGWNTAVAANGHIPVPHHIDLPAVPGWTRAPIDNDHPWSPRFDGADHRLLGRYRNAAGQTVDLAIALYGWQGEGRKLVGYGHGAVDPDGPWRWTNDLPAPADAKFERLMGQDKVTRL
ncbi:MAG: EpsI family protein, partial [Alphaproteobacteria bacterium]|nr:EpsI family protein [Alphaproteobacteria bacterium]